MIINSLLAIPLIGVFFMYIKNRNPNLSTNVLDVVPHCINKQIKRIALQTSVYLLLVSLVIFVFFDFSKNQFQFVLEYPEKSFSNLIEYHQTNLHFGVDGLSIYFVSLTTILMPVSLLSNWTSISSKQKTYLITILLTETLLLLVFLVIDSFLFYIFFESILPPLFILIGSFGSSNRVRASYYLFLYTLLGSLFLLLSIVSMNSITGFTDFDALCKIYFIFNTQLYLFYGIFIAFAVKTPIIMLNSWLLKAHVESPLSGSIILAGIVLKLSLYGILRLILPLLAKAYISCTYIIYMIGIISIFYASAGTLRTIDVKELIAYSSVSHAAVYLLGVFSNIIQGIEGAISLGLAHGFVSSGLFICAGGVLYDRSSTRLITYYRGIAQIMPIFSVIFFILCLANCGVPLTFNFVGEFLSLYGAFERSPVLGALSSSSIIFSAAYSIYMFNRIAFAGSYSKFFIVNMSDLKKRELYILSILALFTVALGIYPAPVLDGLHYSVTTLIYCVPKLYVLTKNKSFFVSLLGFFSFTFSIKSILSLCKREWDLYSPPKPHACVSLLLQSNPNPLRHGTDETDETDDIWDTDRWDDNEYRDRISTAKSDYLTSIARLEQSTTDTSAKNEGYKEIVKNFEEEKKFIAKHCERDNVPMPGINENILNDTDTQWAIWAKGGELREEILEACGNDVRVYKRAVDELVENYPPAKRSINALLDDDIIDSLCEIEKKEQEQEKQKQEKQKQEKQEQEKQEQEKQEQEGQDKNNKEKWSDKDWDEYLANQQASEPMDTFDPDG